MQGLRFCSRFTQLDRLVSTFASEVGCNDCEGDQPIPMTISADGKTVAEPRLFFGGYDARATGMMWGDVKKAYRWFWTEAPNYLALDARPVRLELSQGEHLIKLGGIPSGPGEEFLLPRMALLRSFFLTFHRSSSVFLQPFGHSYCLV